MVLACEDLDILEGLLEPVPEMPSLRRPCFLGGCTCLPKEYIAKQNTVYTGMLLTVGLLVPAENLCASGL